MVDIAEPADLRKLRAGAMRNPATRSARRLPRGMALSAYRPTQYRLRRRTDGAVRTPATILPAAIMRGTAPLFSLLKPIFRIVKYPVVTA